MEKRAVRKTMRKQPGRTWTLVLLFILLVGAFLFLRSPFFAVKHIEVYGNQKVTKEEIIARCGQKSVNIFAFDLDKARRSIEASPWIEKASCSRKLPDTIIVTVVERSPVAFIPIENKIYLVDQAGRVLGEDDGVPRKLVAFTGVTEKVVPGQFLDDSKYGWGFRVLLALGPLAKEKIAEVNVQEGECTLILDDGCKVLMGKERSDVQKLTLLLDSVLKTLSESGDIAEYIDLRFEKQAVKLRSPSGELR
ncbi:MAG TPA: FtsQ-type POTRA domain-containing protein [Firmicutes bacterium]|nr:FtsQ-type POTRA domain-containing protein [Candidatus Fermentithermobacillaceae bacterium]